MKIKILITALFFSGILKAQVVEGQLPEFNFNPPSPEAYQMTKYGNEPINEQSGTVSRTIPIYTYRAGNLTLPITLNYRGAGVKVDQLSSWVGMNFTLDAGGVITRTVKDQVDEKTPPSQRYYLTYAQLASYFDDIHDGTTDAEFFNIAATAPDIDTEVDEFSYSFPGQAGTFFLDADFNVILTKKDSELKIEIDDQGYSSKRAALLDGYKFIATTAEGIKYYFGGPQAYEETALRTIVNGSAQPDIGQGKTAFYLTKIEHPIYGEINFEYATAPTDELTVLSKEQSIGRGLFGPEQQTCSSGGPENGEGDGYQQTDLSFKQVTAISRTIHARTLLKISSQQNPKEINFESENVASGYSQKKLSSIVVEQQSVIKDQFDFTYSYDLQPAGNSRHFLKTVEFNAQIAGDGISLKKQIYKFEYDSETGLPDRFSTGQDFAGYYNGKTSNINLLPDNPYYNPGHASGFANRKPDFDYATKGALTKIIYPTGGYTEFEYEAPPVKEGVEEYHVFSAFRNRPNETPASQYTANWPDFEPDSPPIQPLPLSQNVTFTITLSSTAPVGQINPQDEFATFTIYDVTGSSPVTVFSQLYALQYQQSYRQIQVAKSLLQGQKYRYSITINSNTVTTPIHMEASVGFTLFSGYVAVPGLGIRVKRQTDYAADGQPNNIRRYYYDKIDEITHQPQDLPFLQFSGKVRKKLNVQLCIGTEYIHEVAFAYLQLSSSSVDNFFDKKGFSNYEYVTTSYGGDNFEQGGTEKRFIVDSSFEGATPIPTPSPSPYLPQFQQEQSPEAASPPPTPAATITLGGTLIGEKIFRKNAGGLEKIKETSMVYDEYGKGASSYNLIFEKYFDYHVFYNGITMNNTFSNFWGAVYQKLQFQPFLLSKRTSEFIDPVPLGTANESTFRSIVSVEDYTYDSYAGQPTRIRYTNENDGNVIVKTFGYVDTANSNVPSSISLTPIQAEAYQSLIDNHRLTEPISTKTYYNDTMTSNMHVVYDSFANRSFPSKFYMAKGESSLEERIVYSAYDMYGNPIEAKAVGGALNRYVYTRYGQLALKIENYSAPTGSNTQQEIEAELNETGAWDYPCQLAAQYPQSLVTQYWYDADQQMTKMISPNCIETNYEYDAFHQLRCIKDHTGNVVKTFDYNYQFNH